MYRKGCVKQPYGQEKKPKTRHDKMNLKNTISPKNLVKSFFAFSSIYYGVLFFGLFATLGFIGDTKAASF